MNQYGSDNKTVLGQVSFNKEKMDSLESGLGALVDADLAKESAKLQSLQIRQQLGTQSLSIANQAPQSLLSLFR
jgi:flagellin